MTPWYSRWIFLSFLFGFLLVSSDAQQQQDPSTLNGGSVLAMAGKDCVALAVDKRFGSGPALVTTAPRRVYVTSPQTLVAFTGLEGDVQSLQQELQALVTTKYQTLFARRSSDRSHISPRSMASLTSHVLYGRKQAPYYVEPIVVGLEAVADTAQKNVLYRPYLCSLDMIGAKSDSPSFVCSGSASHSMYGTAQAYWKPDMNKEELLQACATSFLSALERDCLSGYGCILYLITKEGVEEYPIETRND